MIRRVHRGGSRNAASQTQKFVGRRVIFGNGSDNLFLSFFHTIFFGNVTLVAFCVEFHAFY